jgi:N-acyl amino acid synthase of PEP-CTERM/exosortase system
MMQTERKKAPDSIAVNFDRYFSVSRVKTPEQLRQSQGIRFRVYCEEFGYEDPNAFPEQLEIDDYDAQAIHALIIHRETGGSAGCVRMVPTQPDAPHEPLPFERYCGESVDQAFVEKLDLDRTTVCEISRLAVDGAFRRRGKKERQSRYGQVEQIDFSREEQRVLPLIAVSAYLAATAITDHTGHTNVFAMMEPFLPRLMARSGIHFQRAGDDIEYHGTRAPYFITTQSALETMNAQLRELYDVIRDQLFATE